MRSGRKSGLIQSSLPSMSRNELYQNIGGNPKLELKPARRTFQNAIDRFGLNEELIEVNGEFGTPAVPRVIQNPRSAVSATVGETVILVAEALGDASKQWRKDAADDTGQTKSRRVFTNIQLADAGTYLLRFTNAGGSVDSGACVLSVSA